MYRYDYFLRLKMGRLNIVLSDELEDKFRMEVARRKGLRKGNIGKAIEEAIILWMGADHKK